MCCFAVLIAVSRWFRKREMVALLELPFNVMWLLVICFSSSWCSGSNLQCVTVAFPGHTHWRCVSSLFGPVPLLTHFVSSLFGSVPLLTYFVSSLFGPVPLLTYFVSSLFGPVPLLTYFLFVHCLVPFALRWTDLWFPIQRVIWEYRILRESRIQIKPVLGCMRDVVLSKYSNEYTQ